MLAAMSFSLIGWTQSSFRSFGAGSLEPGVNLETVKVSPESVFGGDTATGTVTLNEAAPTGGVAVALSSDNAAVAVPASITVPAGATSATFTVSTTVVGVNTAATLEGTLGNRSKRTRLEVLALAVHSIVLSPKTVTGGGTSTGTLTLNGVAPAAGATVNLSSSSTSISIPATISVASGQSTATFTVATVAVTEQTEARIKASLGNHEASAILTVEPTVSLTITLSPVSVSGGAFSTGTVTLTAAAPSDGLIINLASNDAAAATEPNVRIKPGATSATFPVKTFGVGSATTVTITATVGNASASATLTVTPPTLSAVSLDPNSIGGGASTTGVVTLSGPAPEGGLAVNLSSSQSAAQVQTSVKVPQGRTSATFAVSTTTVTVQTNVTISATLGAASQSATLTISPLALAALTVHPSEISDGQSATGVVELNSPAGTGGVVVSLSADNSAATVPTSVTIPAGHSSVSFKIETASVTAQTIVTLTATLGSTSKTATVSINPATLSALSLEPDRVSGGSTTTGTVKLSGPAPTGGLTITLASNSSSATVPPTVTVPAGQNAITFTVSTTAVTSRTIVQITATLGSATMTKNLTITQ